MDGPIKRTRAGVGGNWGGNRQRDSASQQKGTKVGRPTLAISTGKITGVVAAVLRTGTAGAGIKNFGGEARKIYLGCNREFPIVDRTRPPRQGRTSSLKRSLVGGLIKKLPRIPQRLKAVLSKLGTRRGSGNASLVGEDVRAENEGCLLNSNPRRRKGNRRDQEIDSM